MLKCLRGTRMKLLILITLFLSQTLLAGTTVKPSPADKRLSKWKVKYCDNTLKRKIATECRMRDVKSK